MVSRSILSLAVLPLTLLIAWGNASATDSIDLLRPDFGKIKRDPKDWTSETKVRVLQTIVVAAGLFYLKAKPLLIVAGALLAFSFTNLNWYHVALLIGCYYAYVRKEKLILLGSAWVAYCLFNGYAVLPL